jgi:hypothetical protein
MIADRNHKVIHYFDPLHLRRPVFKGNPTGAAHKLKCYISECAKNDHLCGFSDIENYQMILAHENPTFKDRLPLQLKGNGCAIHCISFAVDLMSGHHASLTDAQTEPLRKVLRALLNTSTPFGTTRSYKQEWEARDQNARTAARDFLDKMEIDISSDALSSKSDHREDKAQSVIQIHRPDLSTVHHSCSAETPMEELKTDSVSQVTPATPQSPATASIGNVCKTTTTSHHNLDQQGETHEIEELSKDDAMDIDAHIDGEAKGEDPSSIRNEEQEPSNSDHQTPPQIQAKVNTVQAVISRLDDQKIKEPVNEKGSRKRQSEEGNEPARKAKKNITVAKLAQRKNGP